MTDGNFIEMIERIQRDAEQAYAAAPSEQRNIGYGDHFLRLWSGVVIFGEIQTEEWLHEHEPEAFDTLRVAYNRGYRFGRCYSEIEPNGEYGDTHVTQMVPLSADGFDEAKARDWDLRRCLADRLEWAVKLFPEIERIC